MTTKINNYGWLFFVGIVVCIFGFFLNIMPLVFGSIALLIFLFSSSLKGFGKLVVVGFGVLMLLMAAAPLIEHNWSFTVNKKLSKIGLSAETKISKLLPGTIETEALVEGAKEAALEDMNSRLEIALRSGNLDDAEKVIDDGVKTVKKLNLLVKKATANSVVKSSNFEKIKAGRLPALQSDSSSESNYPMSKTIILQPGKETNIGLKVRQNQKFVFESDGGFYYHDGVLQNQGLDPWVPVAKGVTRGSALYRGGWLVLKGGYYVTTVKVTVY